MMLNYRYFKIENFKQAIWLINKGNYMASVDLAYYSVKVAEEQQIIFCFKWLEIFISLPIFLMGLQKVYDCSPN